VEVEDPVHTVRNLTTAVEIDADRDVDNGPVWKAYIKTLTD
jgi:hypothetical protein